jgi:hypothetical protein
MHANLSIKPGFVERAFRRFDPEWADSLPAELISDWLGPVLGFVSPDAIADGQLVAYHRSGPSIAYEDGGLGLAAAATVFMPMASGDSIAHQVLSKPGLSARPRSRRLALDMPSSVTLPARQAASSCAPTASPTCSITSAIQSDC